LREHEDLENLLGRVGGLRGVWVGVRFGLIGEEASEASEACEEGVTMARLTTKQYNFNGLAGCVTQKKARRTGTLVGVYNSEQSEVGDVGDPLTAWMTVCEEHGMLVGHSSLKLALSHSSDPEGWCEDCRARNNWYVLDNGTEAFSFNDFFKNENLPVLVRTVRSEEVTEDDMEGVRDLEVGESLKVGIGGTEFTITRVPTSRPLIFG